MDIIQDLKNQFIQEALASPILFNDLANMEKYISESYQMRSIIELLQNADDAGSKKFKILFQGSTLYVANNGRDFNKEDLISICRSGASTKKNKEVYIGYRGIGFKSVVNFAQKIHVLSQDLSFTFSREQTLQLLESNNINGDVPLIRVPHEFRCPESSQSLVNALRDEGFSVIFIFEDIQTNIISSEIESFSPNTLLFLKNVDTVIIDAGQKHSDYKALRTMNSDILNVVLKENSISRSWNIVKTNKVNSPEAIALPLDETQNLNSINNDDYLVYAFLPTKVKTGFNFLLNGSFTTDPSRTQVVIDNQTMSAIKNITELITFIIKKAIEDPKDANKDLITTLSDLSINPIAKFKSSLSFSDVLKEEIIRSLKSMKIIIDGTLLDLTLIYDKPNWLNAADYSTVCKNLNLYKFDVRTFKEIPDLKKIFNYLDLKQISIDKLISTPDSLIGLSKKGMIEILKEFIAHNRFNFTTNKLDVFKSSILFEELNNQQFIKSAETHIDKLDLSWLLSKLSIENQTAPPLSSKANLTPTFANKTKSFSPKFSKWRAAEVNVKAYFESMEGVTSVSDVSKSNLGYDLEVYHEASVEFVEVKSVANLGDGFSLTNNEYGVANEKKDNYTLAIVKQIDKELELCLISNPIESLNLNRRVTRWEWVCDEYSGTITSLTLD